MRLHIATAFLAIGAFAGFAIGAPAYGQSCEITDPPPESSLVNTNGVSGGSGDCTAIGIQSDCAFALGSTNSELTQMCTVVDPVGNQGNVSITCTKTDGAVNCFINPELSDVNFVENFGAFDGVVVEAISGGQNAQISFRFDVENIGGLACTNSQGKASGNTVHICFDGVNEPATNPAPQPLAQCTLRGGETKLVAGVNISCPATIPDFQIKTIVIASELMQDAAGNWVEDPYHGFRAEDGQVETENTCHCFGNGISDEEIAAILSPCDPSKLVVNGPAIDALPECPDGEVVRGRVSIEFGGSHRTCVGGSCAYY